MVRILLNPTFDIETGKLLSHDGESFVESIPIRCDRSVQKSAKQGSAAATAKAGQLGAGAEQIRSAIIPGLEQEAEHPTGYSPLEKGRMLTSIGEGVGGVNAGVTGLANLASARTRNAGGFTSALDEAARIKGRQMASAGLGVENEDARLAQEKQRFAQQQLSGLYGTDTSNQLRAMGLSDEDLRTALEAGKTGWLQNLEGGINTVAGVAGAAGGMGFKPFKR
jgi:hypothetical protein